MSRYCALGSVSPITRRLLSLSHRHHHHYICDLLWYCVCLCDGGVCLMKMNCQIAIASHSSHPITFTQLCFWKLKLLATLDFSSRAVVAAVNTAIYCHSHFVPLNWRVRWTITYFILCLFGWVVKMVLMSALLHDCLPPFCLLLTTACWLPSEQAVL